MTSARPPALLTFGHGTAEQRTIVDLLQGAEVRSLVDVRRFPGSRRNPHVSSEELARWLPDAGVAYRWEPRLGGRPDAGVAYRWEPRLGGRRSLPAGAARGGVEGAEPRDTWWKVEAFRAYAAHTRSLEFVDALGELLEAARQRRTVVLCSETVWWRCHRRLIADVTALLHGREVLHLAHDGRLSPHPPPAGARVTSQGLVYDLPQDA